MKALVVAAAAFAAMALRAGDVIADEAETEDGGAGTRRSDAAEGWESRLSLSAYAEMRRDITYGGVGVSVSF